LAVARAIPASRLPINIPSRAARSAPLA